MPKVQQKKTKKVGSKSGARVATDLRIASRRARIAEMILRGETLQADMAKQLRVSHVTIITDIRAIRATWRLEMAEAFSSSKATELKRIDKFEAEAWLAWERSQVSSE
jgi:hypothetical protein